MMARIMEIQADATLSDAEKAAKRQQLMTSKWSATPAAEAADAAKGEPLQPRCMRPARLA